MTESPTPLTFNDAGEGWHLNPKRRLLLKGAALFLGALLAGAAVAALVQGKPLATLLLLVFAAAIAAIPFGTSRRRLPPTTYDGPEGRGTLLPVHAMRVISIFAGLVLGLLLVLAPVMAIDEGLDGGLWDDVMALVMSLFVALFGLILLLGAYAGVRSRLTPSKGILLTPTRIVLRTQAEPMSFDWEEVRAVRPHWTRSRRASDLMPSPEDVIHNWLTFEVEPGRFEGENALGGMAGTSAPTMDAEKIASDHDATLAFLRLYLASPQLREELGMPASLDRFRSLGAGA